LYKVDECVKYMISQVSGVNILKHYD